MLLFAAVPVCMATLGFDDLKKLNIVMKRAAYFITCKGKTLPGVKFEHRFIYDNLTADTRRQPAGLPFTPVPEQLSFFAKPTLMLS